MLLKKKVKLYTCNCCNKNYRRVKKYPHLNYSACAGCFNHQRYNIVVGIAALYVEEGIDVVPYSLINQFLNS